MIKEFGIFYLYVSLFLLFMLFCCLYFNECMFKLYDDNIVVAFDIDLVGNAYTYGKFNNILEIVGGFIVFDCVLMILFILIIFL